MTPLRPVHHAEATDLLVEAFDEDPFFSFLLPEAAPRAAFLRALMSTNLVLGETCGANHASLDPDLRGVCIWFRPGDYPIGFAQQTRARAAAIGRSLIRGESTPRLLAQAMRAGDLLDEAHPDEPHFYLQTLAVAPAHHGRGIGSSMLRACCEQADRAHLPALLETSKEMNARLYRRFGFETIRTTIAESSPPIWTMWRDPKPLS